MVIGTDGIIVCRIFEKNRLNFLAKFISPGDQMAQDVFDRPHPRYDVIGKGIFVESLYGTQERSPGGVHLANKFFVTGHDYSPYLYNI
jgi:hypothetical protein